MLHTPSRRANARERLETYILFVVQLSSDILIGKLTPLEVSCEDPLLGDELRLNLRENYFMIHQANFSLLLGCTHTPCKEKAGDNTLSGA